MSPDNDNNKGSSNLSLEIIPNPFSQSVRFKYFLPEKNIVTFTIYNVYGQKMDCIINSKMIEDGIHEFDYDASLLSAGIYYCSLSIGNEMQTKKMIVAK